MAKAFGLQPGPDFLWRRVVGDAGRGQAVGAGAGRGLDLLLSAATQSQPVGQLILNLVHVGLPACRGRAHKHHFLLSDQETELILKIVLLNVEKQIWWLQKNQCLSEQLTATAADDGSLSLAARALHNATAGLRRWTAVLTPAAGWKGLRSQRWQRWRGEAEGGGWRRCGDFGHRGCCGVRGKGVRLCGLLLEMKTNQKKC